MWNPALYIRASSQRLSTYLDDPEISRKIESVELADLVRELRRDDRMTSRFRGVSLHRRSSKWQAILRCDGATKFFGHFADERAAARAYDRAAIAAKGRAAQTNFPISEYAAELEAVERANHDTARACGSPASASPPPVMGTSTPQHTAAKRKRTMIAKNNSFNSVDTSSSSAICRLAEVAEALDRDTSSGKRPRAASPRAAAGPAGALVWPAASVVGACEELLERGARQSSPPAFAGAPAFASQAHAHAQMQMVAAAHQAAHQQQMCYYGGLGLMQQQLNHMLQCQAPPGFAPAALSHQAMVAQAVQAAHAACAVQQQQQQQQAQQQRAPSPGAAGSASAGSAPVRPVPSLGTAVRAVAACPGDAATSPAAAYC